MLTAEVSHRLWIESLNRRTGEATIEYAGRSVQWPTSGWEIRTTAQECFRLFGRWDRNWVDEPLGKIVERIQEGASAED